MKRRAILVTILFATFIGVLTRLRGDSPATIHLEADETIQAGEAWSVRISVDDAGVGDKVELTLLNGLIRIDDTVVLGSGGVAEWHSSRLTQAGQSLVSVRYRGIEVRQLIEVIPQKTTALDLFATANTLPSYGEGLATIMILPHDEWGNPPPDNTQFYALARFPDATQKTLDFRYRDALGLTLFRSAGIPGRIRINMADGQTPATIEIIQVPGSPHTITLRLGSECVLSDGRDIVLLTAVVTDGHGSSVADGTLIRFVWKDGFGYGITTQGTAQLRLPAPQTPGRLGYTARSGEVMSNEVFLLIQEKTCADEP